MKNQFIRVAITLAIVGSLPGCEKHGNYDHAPAKAQGPAKTEKAVASTPETGHGHGDAHGAEDMIKLSDKEIAESGIKTLRVSQEAVRATIQVTATIQPNRDRFARVAPRVPGRIVEVPAKAGDRVREGQVLAVLDSVELGESSSAYQQAASQYAVAKADFDRAQRLFDEQVVPQKDFLRARGEHDKARAALTAAADKLRMMGVAPGAGAISRLPVTSPFSGTVTEKTAVIGELAQPDKALFTVADLSTVWIEANLYERDLGRVRVGSVATVLIAAYGDARFSGKLAYIGAGVDRESRTVKARIEVPNPDGRLKPEMFATALIEAEAAGEAIAVPTGAVHLVENRSTVFVREGEGFEARGVELGELVGERQVVKSGLEPGDEVVVAGGYALKSRLLKSKIGEGHSH